jgi:hypothetical protein
MDYTPYAQITDAGLTLQITQPLAEGSHTITLSVTDSSDYIYDTLPGGQITTASISFYVVTIPPTAPSGLIATTISANQIDLQWTDNSDNEQGFKIESKLNNWGDFVQIATVGANITSYSDRRVLTGITHSYRVRAYNKVGDSDYSNITSAIPPGEITYDEKVASGYALISVFRPADWNSVTIAAVQTPEPYEPYGLDSRAYVGETTKGILNLYYTDSVGQTIRVNRTISINNITRIIYYNGIPVTTLYEIFGELDPAPAGDFMCLLMDFPYWLTISMTPVSHLQPQAKMRWFKTDKGTDIETIPRGYYPPQTITDANKTIIITSITPTLITATLGTLIESHVITPTVITPTDSYNCHGWTFTCGSGWLNDPVTTFSEEGITSTFPVGSIISENSYASVTSTNWVHVGALVVYRNITGTVLHTGIVREVQQKDGTRSKKYCDHGTPTLVQSKWEDLGEYLHPPEIVPPGYLPPGGSITYYQPPNRTAPVNTGDPGKDQHTLKPG